MRLVLVWSEDTPPELHPTYEDTSEEATTTAVREYAERHEIPPEDVEVGLSEGSGEMELPTAPIYRVLQMIELQKDELDMSRREEAAVNTLTEMVN